MPNDNTEGERINENQTLKEMEDEEDSNVPAVDIYVYLKEHQQRKSKPIAGQKKEKTRMGS